MQRIALGIEYEGGDYAGWQRQINSPSVQEKLEIAISKVANEPILVVCAGRTDAGVHACGQVIHFDTAASRPDHAWLAGVNNYLPKNIRASWIKNVCNEFNARLSAQSRRYCYVINNSKAPPGIMFDKVAWIHGSLDDEKMHQSAQYLLGNHDFTTFRAAHCQSATPMRTVYAIAVYRKNSHIIIDITANAFLYNMVRNIVGSLILIGKHKTPSMWLKEILEARQRKLAGPKAPPKGLYLVDVTYPTNFALPTALSLPWFL